MGGYSSSIFEEFASSLLALPILSTIMRTITVTLFLQMKKLRQCNQAFSQGHYKTWIGIQIQVEGFWG